MRERSDRLCECGCGERTFIATRTHSSKGIVKGEPLRFVNGHNRSHVRQGPDYIKAVDGCWVWQHARDATGYGRLWNGTRVVLAHRHFYEALHGDIPSDLDIHHVCLNKSCVNPDHLEVLSRSEHKREHAVLAGTREER